MLRVSIIAAIALVLVACEKEDDGGTYRRAGITFRNDPGYIATDDTVSIGDTVVMEAMIAEGSERLRMIYGQYRVGNGRWRMVDSVPFNDNPTVLRLQPIMHSGPRTEEWSILARERNGDATRKTLRITVQ